MAPAAQPGLYQRQSLPLAVDDGLSRRRLRTAIVVFESGDPMVWRGRKFGPGDPAGLLLRQLGLGVVLLRRHRQRDFVCPFLAHAVRARACQFLMTPTPFSIVMRVPHATAIALRCSRMVC